MDPPTQRDRQLAMISEHGRLGWQVATDYGKRSLVETAMGRYKTLIGPRLRARGLYQSAQRLTHTIRHGPASCLDWTRVRATYASTCRDRWPGHANPNSIETGVFSSEDVHRYRGLVDGLRHHDTFMVTADFDSYRQAQKDVALNWADPSQWWAKSIRKLIFLRDPAPHCRSHAGG
jgi:Carbohydrate phosphorylase